MTRAERSRCRAGPAVVDRDELLSALLASAFDARQAGARPKTTPEVIAIALVNRSTYGSRCALIPATGPPGAIFSRTSIAAYATATPTAAPVIESRMHSEMICWRRRA